ncbi:hypothetical protein [Erysipelothrix sp. HDW6C]|uniref:hypothetical protein n=1 Tax=Erysipelothrix sp. HDW6C TaxID=2714930 RepID=UPI00352C4510
MALVKLMLKQDNLLILDEPTNHLDIQGKEALEKALESYDGTMIFVSHDRYFIDKLASDILVIKDGNVSHTEKNMQEILAEEKTKTQAKKETSKESFQSLKRMKNRQKKIEEELVVLSEDLELQRESRFDPDFYHDYEKMDTLNQVIDDIHNEIKHLEEEWAQIAETLEENE